MPPYMEINKKKSKLCHYTLFWLDFDPAGYMFSVILGKTEGMVFHFLNLDSSFDLFNNFLYKIRLGAAK